MGTCGGRGRAHHKHARNSKHPLKRQSFHGSRRYSIYSFAQLSWHSNGENELWILKRSWIPSFLILFSYHRFLFKHLQDRTLYGKILDSFFSSAISFQSFLPNASKNELWMGRYGGRGGVHHKCTLKSEQMSLFLWL